MNNEIEVKSSVNAFEFSDDLSDEVLDRTGFVGGGRVAAGRRVGAQGPTLSLLNS